MTDKDKQKGITIRRLGPGDEAALERLTQLDSGTLPVAPLLGAEIEGRLLVAVSIESGQSVADPFSHTEELRSLLEVRITQLRAAGNGSTRPRRRFRSRRTRAGSHPRANGGLPTFPRVS